MWAQSIMNDSEMFNKTGYEEVYELVVGWKSGFLSSGGTSKPELKRTHLSAPLGT